MFKAYCYLMRFLCILTATLLISVTIWAQANPDEKFTDNASTTFAILAGQARYGFGNKEMCEGFINKSHLTRKNGGDAAGIWWGIWEGQNATVRLAIFAGFPDVLDKTKTHFWVRFDAPTEMPIPQALLSHLLGKARETKVSVGDTLNIELPFEHMPNGCIEDYTLTIRMTSGALINTLVEDYCPVK